MPANIKPEDLHAENTARFKDPGSKRQATSKKHQAPSEPRNTAHGSRPEQQASSAEPQATRSPIRDPGYKQSEKGFSDLGPRVRTKI